MGHCMTLEMVNNMSVIVNRSNTFADMDFSRLLHMIHNGKGFIYRSADRSPAIIPKIGLNIDFVFLFHISTPTRSNFILLYYIPPYFDQTGIRLVNLIATFP